MKIPYIETVTERYYCNNMFRRYKPRKSANPLVVFFRLLLSLLMFAALLAGGFSAYKHFSGADPFKLDPQTIVSDIVKQKFPRQLTALISQKQVLGSKSVSDSKQASKSAPVISFLLIADSHSDSEYLAKAITQAKKLHPDLSFIIGLGDYTNVGTVEELTAAKSEFDQAGLRYFLVPGDHDLWDSRNRSLAATADFTRVFGPNYQAFDYDGFSFLLIDDSDDYKGIDEKQSNWIGRELQKDKQDQTKGILVFTHEPLYHPSSDHFMGKTDPLFKQQAQTLIYQFASAGVKEVFAGDTHDFSQYSEPQTNLPMVTVGAVTRDRNLQLPRFAVGYVFADGSVRVEDVEIK